MTEIAQEENIFVLSEKNEHERSKIERISKSLWISNYAPDIFMTMKESELRRRPLFFMSSQMDQRPTLVQLCQLITRTYKLGRCALHLSIYYLDRLIDFYTIRADKLQLVALICIHIAAQIESTEALVPRYSEMNRLIEGHYEVFEYKAVERKVLTFFKFELMRPTTASFVELFACSFLTRDDYLSYCKARQGAPSDHVASYPHYNCFEQMLAALAQLLLRLSDYTLCINQFRGELPSFLVAICIATTRQVCGVPKRWTPYLSDLTSYTEDMVDPYVDILRQYHYTQTMSELEKQKKTDNNSPSLDSGFEEKQNKTDSNSQSLDSGFEEKLSVSQLESVSVGMETINVITVKLPVKRNRSHLPVEEPLQHLKRSKPDNEERQP